MPDSAIYLSYDDAEEAIAWLQALGFRVLQKQTADTGTVAHGELVRGTLVVMLGSNDADYQVPPLAGVSTGIGVYLVAEDVDALFDQAIAAGGRAVFPPEQTPWGSRRARVLDPGGREWSFGSYRPGS
jgi:uncharacterized glyoxalase superfamily protein PhnB